jgi:hypothetical protein
MKSLQGREPIIKKVMFACTYIFLGASMTFLLGNCHGILEVDFQTIGVHFKLDTRI